MPREYRWTDISCAPMSPGDLVIIRDDKSENEHSFRILTINNDVDGVRRASVKLMSSTNKNFIVGKTVNLSFSPSKVVMGAVLRQDELNDNLDAVELNNVIHAELYRWLTGQPESNYRRKVKDCVGFLATLKLLPDNEDYKTAKNRLLRIIKGFPEYYHSVGGYISATGVSTGGTSNIVGSVGGATVVRHISFNKLTMAIRLLIESGVFGDVILDE